MLLDFHLIDWSKHDKVKSWTWYHSVRNIGLKKVVDCSATNNLNKHTHTSKITFNWFTCQHKDWVHNNYQTDYVIGDRIYFACNHLGIWTNEALALAYHHKKFMYTHAHKCNSPSCCKYTTKWDDHKQAIQSMLLMNRHHTQTIPFMHHTSYIQTYIRIIYVQGIKCERPKPHL